MQIYGKYDSQVNMLLERGFSSINAGEWITANNLFDEALNIDYKCAEAYIGKLCAANHAVSLEEFFADIANDYAVADEVMAYACEENTNHITKMIEANTVSGYLEPNEIRALYQYNLSYKSLAASRMRQKRTALTNLDSDKLLSLARNYADSNLARVIETGISTLTNTLDERVNLAKQYEKSVSTRIVQGYNQHIVAADAKVKDLNRVAVNNRHSYYLMAIEEMKQANTTAQCVKVHDMFIALGDYEKSGLYARLCHDKIDAHRKMLEEKAKEKARIRSKRIKTLTVIASILVVLTLFVALFLYPVVLKPIFRYNNAVKLKDSGKYEEALEIFEELDDYEDSEEMANYCRLGVRYNKALAAKDEGRYMDAIQIFSQIRRFEDSIEQIDECHECMYDQAILLRDRGLCDEAIAVFESLEHYRDSDEQIQAIRLSSAYIEFSQPGDILLYGSYNGQPLEWIVLDNDDGNVLVLAKDAISIDVYASGGGDSTWGISNIRNWLNDDFFSSAFSAEEQSRISTFTYYYVPTGIRTEDKVFLLSVSDVYNHVPEQYRVCTYNGEPCTWWLRTPGSSSWRVACVEEDGTVYAYGYVGSGERGIRPAIILSAD